VSAGDGIVLLELPAVARHVDAELARLDDAIDWLWSLSPVHNQAMWQAFRDSGYRSIPPMQYAERELDLHGLREELLALPIEDIEEPLVDSLLREKQRELDRQLELIRLRGKPGFHQASIDLFGDVPARLKQAARAIMASAPPGHTLPHDVGLDEVVDAAERELAWYRERVEGFSSEVIVDDDLNSLLMVSRGRLHVAGDIRIARSRVDPLIQHEIGTHVVTHHNGSRQPLMQLSSGLAHYDALQEGLGVLAEYLAGYLPAERMRVIAGRAIAADLMLHDADFAEVFACLHDNYLIDTEDAFDISVRAFRGGGLTKDAVYLAGLSDILDYLAEGEPFEDLFIGKFALSQLDTLRELSGAGWVRRPDVMPRYLEHPAAVERLEQCRGMPLDQFFHWEPPA
jgi:uncharacterized protein (TIGR02421 family)